MNASSFDASVRLRRGRPLRVVHRGDDDRLLQMCRLRSQIGRRSPSPVRRFHGFRAALPELRGPRPRDHERTGGVVCRAAGDRSRAAGASGLIETGHGEAAPERED
jgi:hypothetical protein